MDDPQEISLEFEEPQDPLSPEPCPDESGGSGIGGSPPEESRREPFSVAREARDGESGSLNSIDFRSGHVSAGRIELAGQVLPSALRSHRRWNRVGPSLARHFKSRSLHELEICEEELVFEDRELEELRSSFEETRFLILAGEPEGGKGSLGLLLSARIARSLQWRGLHTCRASAPASRSISRKWRTTKHSVSTW